MFHCYKGRRHKFNGTCFTVANKDIILMEHVSLSGFYDSQQRNSFN